mgnify:CR=1 FL=1
MEKRLGHGETHRLPGAGIFDGIWVCAVDAPDTSARVVVETQTEYGAGRAYAKLNPEGLRALAADLLAAAQFIDDCAAEREIAKLTGHDPA